MNDVLLRRADVDGRVVDVSVHGGVITSVGEGLDTEASEVFDVDGAAVLPGLHDHHLHLLAMAAARGSVDVRDAAGPEAFDAAVRAAATERPGGIRVIGYHEHHCGPLDETRLRALVGEVPARVQHATGAAWLTGAGWT